jgi:hypothetical protein
MSDFGAEYLRSILDYDPDEGVFRWRHRSWDDIQSYGWNTRCAGKVAGCISWTGYRVININGVQYTAAKLAWLHHFGEWPQYKLRCINCKRDDVRISNLETAPRTGWRRNQRVKWVVTTGYPAGQEIDI